MKHLTKTLLVTGFSLWSLYAGSASAVPYYEETIKLYNYVTPLARDVTAPLELVGNPVVENNGARCDAWSRFGDPLAKAMAPGYMGHFTIRHTANDHCSYDNVFTLIFTYAVQQEPSKTCTVRVIGGSYKGWASKAVRKALKLEIIGSTGLPCLVSGNDKEGYTVGLGPYIIKK